MDGSGVRKGAGESMHSILCVKGTVIAADSGMAGQFFQSCTTRYEIDLAICSWLHAQARKAEI